MVSTRYKQYGDLLTLGIMFPACIAIGYGPGLAGGWVDRQPKHLQLYRDSVRDRSGLRQSLSSGQEGRWEGVISIQ